MTRGDKRREKRKFNRHEVMYGPDKPVHRAVAVQLSGGGAFLTAIRPIFSAGSRIVVRFSTNEGDLQTAAVVRHAKSLPPGLTSLGRSGMGVQFLSPPEELVRFIESL